MPLSGSFGTMQMKIAREKRPSPSENGGEYGGEKPGQTGNKGAGEKKTEGRNAPQPAAPAGFPADISVCHPAGFVYDLFRRYAGEGGRIAQKENSLLKQAGVGGFYHNNLTRNAFYHTDFAPPFSGGFCFQCNHRESRIYGTEKFFPAYCIFRKMRYNKDRISGRVG